MKSRIRALILIGTLGALAACDAQSENARIAIEDVKQETQDFVRTIGSYTADKRDEAVQNAEDGLTKLDKRIDALEARIDKNWDKMTKAAREESREDLKALRKQRNQVAEWYGRMKTSSVDAWDHVRTGFSDAYMDFEDAWEKSEKKLGASE